MIVYKEYINYNILGEIISVFSTETDYGLSTVVEFDKKFYYYLGDEPADIESAMFAWQDYYNYQLCDSELSKILEDNKNSKFEILLNFDGIEDDLESSSETSDKETS